MSLYVYCLSDEVEEGAVSGALGVAGGDPCLISCGGIKAVVSAFDGERIAVTRDNVLAHEGVIRRVLAQTTPLPFRFGTLVTADRLREYVDSQRGHLEALLARVRGAVEMGVKIIWDVEAVKNAAARAATPPAQVDETPGPGRAFLLARQRELAGGEARKAQAEEIAAWLERHLGDAVRETAVTVRPAESLVVSAAHLVERAKLEMYRERLERARKERADLYFLTSGAWPPYSFTTLRS
ncbi:MAG TPA: GvpL/GvpF family gas vesicle protein [Blastocatellia bacterium]|nr:GvpL/GvpF family gas vesicle protein [Blastocatellia bacterium]